MFTQDETVPDTKPIANFLMNPVEGPGIQYRQERSIQGKESESFAIAWELFGASL